VSQRQFDETDWKWLSATFVFCGENPTSHKLYLNVYFSFILTHSFIHGIRVFIGDVVDEDYTGGDDGEHPSGFSPLHSHNPGGLIRNPVLEPPKYYYFYHMHIYM